MDAEQVKAELSKYTTCDVADALQKLGHTDGGFIPGLTLFSPERQAGPTKIVGPIFAVEYALHEDWRDEGLKGHYIDAVPANTVLVIGVRDPLQQHTDVALYGGLMSTRAKNRGALGTVVGGRIRDLEEHRGLAFPVWAQDVGVASYVPVLKMESIGKSTTIPVPVNGPDNSKGKSIVVTSGDYLMADLNGVVVIQKQEIQDVLGLIPSEVEADEKIAEDLAKGRPFAEAAKEHRGNVKTKKDLQGH